MARNNYSYEKYQREQAKKKKKEAKRLKKLNRALGIEEEKPEGISEDVETADEDTKTTVDE